MRDKAHFFGAYEFVDRSLDHRRPGDHRHAGQRRSGSASRCRRAASFPRTSRSTSGSARSITRSTRANRLSARYFLFKNFSESNIGGGLTTPDRATDFTDRMDSASAQLSSIIGADELNELRVQYARRHQFRTLSPPRSTARRSPSPASPSSAARASATPTRSGFDFNQGIWQVDRQLQLDPRQAQLQGGARRAVHRRRPRARRAVRLHLPEHRRLSRRAARRRAARLHDVAAGLRQSRRRATRRPSTASSCRTTGRSTPHLKLLYGLRYDVFDVPSARPFARQPVLAGLHHRQEQLGAARRALVVARRQRRAPCCAPRPA